VQGIIDVLDDKPNAQPEVQEELAKMVPDTKYKKARAEFGVARRKVQKLNEANNALTLRVKQLGMEKKSAWGRKYCAGGKQSARTDCDL
jgi:hypothetical protein